MPVVVDSPQGPARWATGGNSHATGPAAGRDTGSECLHIALVNNMPDTALEDTEFQFCQLLDAASERVVVRLKLISLPNIHRSDHARARLRRQYFGIDELWNRRFDALIITGSEPRERDLRQEVYWPVLTEVLDWAQENTVCTVLSCLAAHASVLHSDGIKRYPLGDKQFGVFEYRRVGNHALGAHAGNRWRFPHSRWNEVRTAELASCGYTVLGLSEDAGVDLFVKKKRNSLFVYFQGHPEYETLTLLKEYRRDTRRFLQGITETYPSMPEGYLNAAATGLLNEFQRHALMNRLGSVLADFPQVAVASVLKNTWRLSAIRIYRNWLRYAISRKASRLAFTAVSAARFTPSASANGGIE